MNAPLLPPVDVEDAIYPDSDGKPMADNTIQFRHIVMVQGGLDSQFRDDPNVLVVGDVLWYPVQGHPEISAAPDTMVIFGRPKGDRRSYRQWREGNISPHVAFEILSPNNTVDEMQRKFEFYERHGVEEYYVFDPEPRTLTGYQRVGDEFQEIEDLAAWVSPRLGVRFDPTGTEQWIIGRDGQPFQFYVDVAAERDLERRGRRRAENARRRAENARRRAENARRREEIARERAETEHRQEERARERAEDALKAAEERLKTLGDRMRGLGLDPDA